MQLTPSLAITQLISALCIFTGCEQKYPSPVEGDRSQFQAQPQISLANFREFFRTGLGTGTGATNSNAVRSISSSSSNPSPSYTVTVLGSNVNNGENSLNFTNTKNETIVTRRGRLAEKGQVLKDLENNELNSRRRDDRGDEDVVVLPPVLDTSLGRVEGYHMKIVSGKQIYAFEGIPYAETPNGTNRFQSPKPHPGWNGTLQALDPGPACIQLSYGRMKGSEDCLRLNIYTTKIPSGKSSPKLPVLVYIHGGWFLSGSGSNYGPTYLLRENLVLVTFNYRLGIMGAFTTGDGVASGNWGLKDQAFAINWVHKHISSFGGDPDHIILMGQSAGAVSTHLQMMSPLARDKLYAAITMSGGGYNVWGLNTLEQGVRISRNHARLARCPFEDSPTSELLECMQALPAEVITANSIFTNLPSSVLPVPMIEPDVPGAFLSEVPDDAYRNGHVAKIPLISTVTSEEINAFITELVVRGGVGVRILNGIFDIDAPTVLSFRGKISRSAERRVVTKIRRYYGIGPLRLRIPREFFTKVGNARYFTVPFHKMVQMHSQIAPTYAGIFNYTNNPLGRPIRLGLDPKEYGVTHTDDLVFIFNSTNKPSITQNDYGFALTKLLANIYSNFGKTSVPSFKSEDGIQYKFWDVVKDPQNFQILQIDEEVKMTTNPYAQPASFWESLEIPDMTPFIKLKSQKT